MSLEYQPPMPTGSGQEAVFHQSTKRRLDELKFISSPSVRVSRTTKGFYFAASVSNKKASIIQPMTIVSEQDDYLTCTLGEAATPGDPPTPIPGPTMYVAKPYLLQRTTYDGVTVTLFDGEHTYDYVSENIRTDTITINDSDTVFNQMILDQYLVGDVILCTQPIGGPAFLPGQPPLIAENGTLITWQDLNCDAREWATEFTACATIGLDDVAGFQLVKGSDFYLNSIVP